MFSISVDKPLDGQVAVVTGASSGIGAAIAQGLAQAGAKVAMAARREERLLELKQRIESDDGVAIAVKCDVTNRQEVSGVGWLAGGTSPPLKCK